MAVPVQRFVDHLSQEHQVVLIGGLAVIAHGRNRHTKDVDIWLDPAPSPSLWADSLRKSLAAFPMVTVHVLPGWEEIDPGLIDEHITHSKMLRLLGLDKPLDVFREPNEFEIHDFAEVVARAKRNSDGTYLPDPLDLFQSKIDTGRKQDQEDMQFLEGLARQHHVAVIPTATLAEAARLLDRFSDWQVLQAALTNPAPEVQALARTHLQEFAEAGDPFSQAILAGREIPGE